MFLAYASHPKVLFAAEDPNRTERMDLFEIAGIVRQQLALVRRRY